MIGLDSIVEGLKLKHNLSNLMCIWVKMTWKTIDKCVYKGKEVQEMKTQSERRKISWNDELKKIKSPYLLISVYLVIERDREREYWKDEPKETKG